MSHCVAHDPDQKVPAHRKFDDAGVGVVNMGGRLWWSVVMAGKRRRAGTARRPAAMAEVLHGGKVQRIHRRDAHLIALTAAMASPAPNIAPISGK